ncbi:MAG: PfkB family carbohydrate kinase [Chloroflexota bacterium]|nr:PfkB family carbohydrate kinase [Chloroflexota bacterium]
MVDDNNVAESYVLVIGNAALDAKASVREPLSHDSSVPGRIRISVGGVARNVAECLARFEVPTILFSAVGDDPLSDYLLEVTARTGVDVSPTLRVPGARSGAFFAMIKPDGTRTWCIDDMATLAHLTPEAIVRQCSLLQGARAVVLDNNLPLETLETIIQICDDNEVSICADPTSSYLAPRFVPFLSSFKLVTPNQREAAILCDCVIDDVDDALKAAQQLVRMGVRMALITMGDMGVVYATANESGHVRAPNVDLVDLTGGSDAVTATVVFALINDFPVDEAVRLAVTAAALTITTQDTVRSDLSLELLYDSMLV